MFKKNDVIAAEKFDTLVGKTSRFEGQLHSQGTVRIDGEFLGNIQVTGDIIIGEEGKMIGDISANNVTVSGCVEGNINAANQLKINTQGKVLGDIHILSLIVEENSIFEGKCTMVKASNKDNAISEVIKA